jgi:hypothetical protein
MEGYRFYLPISQSKELPLGDGGLHTAIIIDGEGHQEHSLMLFISAAV